MRKARRHDFTTEIRVDTLRFLHRRKRVNAFARSQVTQRLLVSPYPLALHGIHGHVHHHVLARVRTFLRDETELANDRGTFARCLVNNFSALVRQHLEHGLVGIIGECVNVA